jgi:RNA polymerase sigma-70 factor, ECF subfamily
MSWPSDDAVMRDVRAGNAQKLAILFDRHHVKLFRFFLRMTGDAHWSEDLVQEVFVRMLRYRASYREDGGFTAWMYRIARNVHTDQAKPRGREAPLMEGWDAPSPPGPSLEQDQNLALVRKALVRLPADKRELLVLARFQGLKYEQIAAILECEVGAVKVRVFRALRSLREIYFELSGEKAS